MNRHVKKKMILLIVTLFFLLAGVVTSGFALTLHEAKDQGLVGEKPNGYIGAVAGKGSSSVQALLKDINQKRKQKYQEIAKQNKTTLEAVEMLAGKKALQKTRSGHYIQLPSGEWGKK